MAICSKTKKEGKWWSCISQSPDCAESEHLCKLNLFCLTTFHKVHAGRLGQETMFFEAAAGQTLCLGSSDWLNCRTERWNFGGTHLLTDLAHNYSSAETNEPLMLNMTSSFDWFSELYSIDSTAYDKKSDEGSNSVRMRHKNSGASKNDFPPEFQNRQMHSFPIMYNTMGSKLDGLAVRDHFLPKNGLKTAILGDTILDRLTSEGTGTQIFKAIANFSMCLKKFGTLSSNWAMDRSLLFGTGGSRKNARSWKIYKREFFPA